MGPAAGKPRDRCAHKCCFISGETEVLGHKDLSQGGTRWRRGLWTPVWGSLPSPSPAPAPKAAGVGWWAAAGT